MSGPISPEQAKAGHRTPEAVYEVVNGFLAERSSSASIRITQDEVERGILARIDVDRHRIYAENWLDFEDAYRGCGWTVKYDKPGYNETYDAHWVFSRGGK